MMISSLHLSTWRSLPVVLLCLASSSPIAAASIDRYEGLAYARSGKSLIYQETHWRYQEDAIWQHLVLYSCPNGTPFARKLLRESPNAEIPDFDFQDARDGYREGVRKQGVTREVYVQRNDKSSLEAQPLVIPPGAVIDAGFDAFIRNHWSELANGGSVKVPFLIPSQKSYLDFEIADAHDTAIDGRPVRRFRMKLATWYGFAVPAIELTYERDGSRLVEFQGIGTIRDAQGSQMDVRIVFPSGQRSESSSSAEIKHAQNRPLSTVPCTREGL